MDNTLKIFSGRSNPILSKRIIDRLGLKLGDVTIRTFADGELWVKFEENIRGKDVFIIQSTNGPAENLIELFLLIDAAVRASAQRVTAVIPYFGYGRQDRKDQPRVPISSRVMVDILTATGADRIISMDLHSTQIQGFASIPFDHIYSRMVLLDKLKSLDLNPEECTVLSPDVGSAAMGQSYAKRLGFHFALIDKRRYAPNKAEVSHLIGDLKGKDVLIIDDMIDTAGTTVSASKAAVDEGANSVIAVATHGVLSGSAIERLKSAPINKIIITDTIAVSDDKKIPKMDIVSVADVFSEAIKRIHKGESVSALFNL
ncbi:MAG: ribose-phosphate pyrophosphokinase [Candidatus Neomarinimicrobiota bacterium]|nr:ribose-phosphate pyrophosphokinase [Candidatus Neomarinimicrobiota bacterium]